MSHGQVSTKKRVLIVLVGCSLLISLALGELAVRLIGHYDIDGNFYVHTLKCYPYHLPVQSMKKIVKVYLASTGTVMTFDRQLGWAPRPGSKSENGLYSFNKDGIRTPSCGTVFSKTPPEGRLRISIFGDSFTHGDEVAFKYTWGRYLEDALKKHNVSAEVLNFGVGGYGIDQAFLRWELQGRLYKPSIVIFGLSLENMSRNVNLIREIYCPATTMPFAKPRYVLTQGKMSLINVPVPDPVRVIDIMRHFSSWELSQYEYWYRPDEYQDSLLFKSKLISFLLSSFRRRGFEQRTNSEALEDLSLRILTLFKEEVESAGGKFYVVYLPFRTDVNLQIPPHPDFFKRLEAVVPVIHPERRLSKEAGWDIPRFMPLHYRSKANTIVGDVIADFVIKQVPLTKGPLENRSELK